MLFAGKRIEMVFEYLPDEVAVAEAFFKFKLANAGLEQLFVFAGKVVEPKVSFSSNKVSQCARLGQPSFYTPFLTPLLLRPFSSHSYFGLHPSYPPPPPSS